MNDKKFSMCCKIIGRLEDMQTTEYYFKSPIIAKAYDGNQYTITGIKYDCDMEGTDLDGALLVQVKTDWLNCTTIDVDGFFPNTVELILESLPIKSIIRVSAHIGRNSFIIIEHEVDLNCHIGEWCEKNFPALRWEYDDEDQLVCYGDYTNNDNYLLATLVQQYGEQH